MFDLGEVALMIAESSDESGISRSFPTPAPEGLRMLCKPFFKVIGCHARMVSFNVIGWYEGGSINYYF